MPHRATPASPLKISLAALLALVALALTPLLADPAPPEPPAPTDKSQAPGGPPPIETKILIPLTGNKTTFRFQVTNRGKNTAFHRPFINDTKFIYTDPDGKEHQLSAMAENAQREGLASGETRTWDLDIAGNIKFTKKGNYTIAFVINGVRSNEITLAVDDPAAAATK